MLGILLSVLRILQLGVAESTDPPTGHLQPLGGHRPPLTSVEERDTFPSPKEMFEKYVKPSKPVIFRGILEKGMLPAYQLWTDSYLREHFGSETVDVESGKKENRGGNMLRINMSEFLDRYPKDDIYMVDDASERMAKEINMPSMLLCGGFQKIVQNVIMWFSSGGTKSVLHNDGLDNVNCLIDGDKYFVMIDKKHKADVEDAGWVKNGAYSKVDVEKVDLYKFPRFRDLPWYEVKMHKGDCLFIPYKWFHHVDSRKGRNFAINIWFSHITKFNESDCSKVNLDELKFVSVSQFRKGQGVSDFRDFLAGELEDSESMDWKSFERLLSSTGYLKQKEIEKLFNVIDADKDGKMTEYELEMADVEEALMEIPAIQKLLRDVSTEEDQEEDNHSPPDANKKIEKDNDHLADFRKAPKQKKDKKDEL